jgi:hypothetical protein
MLSARYHNQAVLEAAEASGNQRVTLYDKQLSVKNPKLTLYIYEYICKYIYIDVHIYTCIIYIYIYVHI